MSLKDYIDQEISKAKKIEVIQISSEYHALFTNLLGLTQVFEWEKV